MRNARSYRKKDFNSYLMWQKMPGSDALNIKMIMLLSRRSLAGGPNCVGSLLNPLRSPGKFIASLVTYNADRGLKPLIRLMKHPSCDAGTALRLFWINDPVYFSDYSTISECPYEEEQDAMRLLRTIKLRFKKNDFQSKKMYFDPEPWIQEDDVDLEVLQLPAAMLQAVPGTKRGRR